MNASKIVSKLLEDDAPASKLELASLKGKPVAEACDLVNAHYHENLTYKGMEFFDGIYMGKIVPCAEKALGISNERNHNHGRENRRGYEGQESYLGYLPDEDVFVSGWDMFEGEDGDEGDGICYIKVDAQGNARAIRDQVPVSNFGMMYGKNGGLDKLKAAHKNLVDIRLD
jgi:hypothetical protein